jgi:hypothetical protein
MKKKLFLAGLFVLMGTLVIAWGWGSVKGGAPKQEGPRTVFYFGLPEKPVYSKSVVDSPKSRYVFEPVLQFDLVKHDFIVRNTSKQVLELKKVKACCGSLVEAYSDHILPGQEGVIKTVLLTERRGGEEIEGTIHLLTNDPENPEWTIDVSCFVKKFADISRHTIMLSGSWKKPIEGSSVVIPTRDYPFRVIGVKAKKAQDITYGYKETTWDGKEGYLVWAKNVRKKPGVIRDTIYVQTDNPARPEFIIRVLGKVTD